MASEVDLRAAINAVSDVVQNRPLPLREFDQIYMKTGDMVMQSEFVARWAAGKRLAFVGDGDAISVCVSYLVARGILEEGPSMITVFDFDERIVNAVKRFASAENIHNLDAELYNCLDAVPAVTAFDCFYTNPPWGASNGGESVNLFVERGFELIGYGGDGLIVIADDLDLDWPKQVLHAVQKFATDSGFYVSRMTPRLHSYHLDDAPDLRSCNLIVSAVPGNARDTRSEARDKGGLAHFYGRDRRPHVHYVRDISGRARGTERQEDYRFELFEERST
ncbi:bis-aminopropyl spermidine synthase family protein [Cryocola sp. 340MFSha3.1]|uniref:bis-aminopropyl spermidine synthase family protein n=1 Tax=Cryocola sp. 340MFSha3.1 TaxID=1169145 RepID=UPI0012DFCED6|nr:bis-aminopropyl spermidine synthase family protein [Cryocola sp. 340MFSha3.1]